MQNWNRIALFVAFLALTPGAFALPSNADTVKVFVLAGQSNMEGKAKMSLLELQVEDERTKERFAHLRDGEDWVERDDVLIKFLDRKGKLTVGYGSPNCIGPELDFGHTVGDHYDEPVLIIKTAWGGKSLYRDFRSPSAGFPDDPVLEGMLEQSKKRKPEATMDDVKQSFGHFYRLMIEDVRETMKNAERHFPELAKKRLELAGFVWFQGWNDMISEQYTAEYKTNMVHFIRDVRRDLEAPKLPFVIGQFGVGGTSASHPKHLAFKKAQADAAEEKDFRRNVAVVQTDQYWDEVAQEVFDRGWKENLEEWTKVGSDRPYHYLGSALTYSDIGAAFGRAIIELRGDKKKR